MFVGAGRANTDSVAVKPPRKKFKTSAGQEVEGEAMPTPLLVQKGAVDEDMEAEPANKAIDVTTPSSNKKLNVSPDSKTPGSGSQPSRGAMWVSKDHGEGAAGGKKAGRRKKADLVSILQKGVAELRTAEQSSPKFFGAECRNVKRNWDNYCIDLHTHTEEEKDATNLELYQVVEK